MRFEDQLGEAAVCVEIALAASLDETTDETPAHLLAAMRHGLLGGGKRLRPFLVMASAGLFGVSKAVSVRAAAALECVHCYSLVHDDLPAMDDDALRRGKPTVHIAFGEATAILAGDALLTLAFEILADERTHKDTQVRAALVRSLARAAGARGMVGGQMLDLQAGAQAPDEAGIARLQAMKTGALIRHACEAGALVGGAAPDERERLLAYGDALGAAFQIGDDILDREGDVAELGKATGKDAGAGKATLVDHLGLAVARERMLRLVARAKAQIAPFGDAAGPLAAAADFVVTRRK